MISCDHPRIACGHATTLMSTRNVSQSCSLTSFPLHVVGESIQHILCSWQFIVCALCHPQQTFTFCLMCHLMFKLANSMFGVKTSHLCQSHHFNCHKLSCLAKHILSFTPIQSCCIHFVILVFGGEETPSRFTDARVFDMQNQLPISVFCPLRFFLQGSHHGAIAHEMKPFAPVFHHVRLQQCPLQLG